MRNEALLRLEVLVGEWTMTMTDAWFLDSLDVKVMGEATIGWLGDAFLEMRGTLGMDHGSWHWVIGRSDAREQLVAAVPRRPRRPARLRDGVRRRPVDARPGGSGLPSALHRERGSRPYRWSMGGVRGCRLDVEEGLRPDLRPASS